MAQGDITTRVPRLHNVGADGCSTVPVDAHRRMIASWMRPDGSVSQRVPAGNGRAVQVRSLEDGTGIQLAVISTRGNLIESVSLTPDQLAALIADEKLARIVHRNRMGRDKRHKEALARNSWLRGERS